MRPNRLGADECPAAPDGFRVSEPRILGGPQFGGRYLDVAEVGDEPRAP
jgi:hypothetical protein